MTSTIRPSGRLRGWRTSAVWAVAVLAVIVIVGASAIHESSAPSTALMVTLVLAACVASFGFVGAIVAVRLPRNPIGWILWASAPVIAGSLLGTSYVLASVSNTGPVAPAVLAVAVLANVALFPLLGLVVVFLPLLFPDGHLPSPRWRWAARGSAAAIVAATTLYLLKPGPLSGSAAIQNPLGLSAFDENPDAIGWLMAAMMLVPVAVGAAAVIVRYRHGGPVERQQVRWFGGAVGLMVLGVYLGTTGIGPLGDASWILTFAGIALLPIAVGMAILRYRLYDIDRIVSRTIGYLIVTGVLALVFVGAVILFQAVLAPFLGENPVAVAASTLVVAALFQPLRTRVQRVVDRRFNRARYNAERTAEAFAARLRDQVELGALLTDLVATVGGALDPGHAAVWIRQAEER